MILYKCKGEVPAELEEKLHTIGCDKNTLYDLSLQGQEALFADGAFFSSLNTGKRIISFALKENGLNQEKLQEIEESIVRAYNDAEKIYGGNELLNMSYRYSLQTLLVFRL